MNVKTGAILAMASKPDFDPNAPLDFSENLAYLNEQVKRRAGDLHHLQERCQRQLSPDEQGKKIPEEDPDYTGTYRDIQWKNKTITELYYPGSVFKVITAAMGVDSGKATYYTTFNCSGAYGVAKETYHCAGKKAHGVQNLAEASGTAATSTSSSWVSGWVPASSTTTSTLSASPSAPAWTCPTRRA